MRLGKSIRIYLANASVAGIRHGEIVNWTGQAIACPRARFPELKEWSEAKRPGVYFLFGQNEKSGQEIVYIGEAENVLDRLYSHLSGKDFWAELIAFTSKDDNLTKGHVRYLESRLVQSAHAAGRYEIENTASPQLPSLPRSDRDSMEEFIEGVRTLLGVLGHRVLEPLVAETPESQLTNSAKKNISTTHSTIQTVSGSSINPEIPIFELRVSGLTAKAIRTDEGLVVLSNSEASLNTQNSLSSSYRNIRDKLLSTSVLVQEGLKLKFSKDQLFTSPSQAAAVIVGYSINGRDAWRTLEGVTFSEYENKLAQGAVFSNP